MIGDLNAIIGFHKKFDIYPSNKNSIDELLVGQVKMILCVLILIVVTMRYNLRDDELRLPDFYRFCIIILNLLFF